MPPLVHQRLLHLPHGRLQQLLHQQQHLLLSSQASTRPLTARSRRAGYGAHGRHCLTAETAEAGGPSPRQQEKAEPLTDLGGNSSVINCIFTIQRKSCFTAKTFLCASSPSRRTSPRARPAAHPRKFFCPPPLPHATATPTPPHLSAITDAGVTAKAGYKQRPIELHQRPLRPHFRPPGPHKSGSRPRTRL